MELLQKAFIASILSFLFFIIGCQGPAGPRGLTGHDTLYVATQDWSNVLDSIKTSSYMIGLRDENARDLILVGSGSAINQNTIITNAHVFDGIIDEWIILKQLGYNITPVAVQNGTAPYGTNVYPLNIGGSHNFYDTSTVFTYDIGFFTTSTPMNHYLNIPINDTIQKIRVGQSIGTLGFPGETADRIKQLATATFKDGIISALFPFSATATPTPANSFVLQHNFNTTPGTSGSPIVDTKGRLIAVNNSGAVMRIWNDATGSFSTIPTGSIGYGIRADIVNDMFAQNNFTPDTVKSYYVPNMYSYFPGSRISLKNGTKPVYLGTTMAVAKTAADQLLNTNVGKDPPAFQVLTDGSLYYTDSCSYVVEFLKESATLDNVWSIFITGTNTDYSRYYLPSFYDFWGITIGTSRAYILSTYGNGYDNVFSIDSTVYYYNYPTIGVGFGFRRTDNDWQCDCIQMGQIGKLAKTTAEGQINVKFPNLGVTDIPKIIKAAKRVFTPIRKIFK
jgi:V8-like Glu-specific endopeptidase